MTSMTPLIYKEGKPPPEFRVWVGYSSKYTNLYWYGYSFTLAIFYFIKAKISCEDIVRLEWI